MTGDLPDDFETFAEGRERCAGCGEDVRGRYIEDGRCVGCRYGGIRRPVPDGGTRTLEVFEVHRDPDQRREGVENVLGWGVQYPSGWVVLDWNLQAVPPDEQLDHPHLSQYGSADDVQEAIGGAVELVDRHDVGERPPAPRHDQEVPR